MPKIKIKNYKILQNRENDKNINIAICLKTLKTFGKAKHEAKNKWTQL